MKKTAIFVLLSIISIGFTTAQVEFKQVLNDKVANRPTIVEAIEYIDHANDTIASEPVVETNIKIDKALLRKGLVGNQEIYYFILKNPNGLFVNHNGLSCILEDNDSIPFNGIVKEYNEYGNQLVAEHNFINGKKEGIYKFYIKGELYSEVNYVNGKKEGQEYVYIQDQKYLSSFWVNDKLEGKRTLYSDNGQVDEIYNYVNGKLEGKRIQYLDGRVISTFNYVNGKKEGKYEYFFENGGISQVCYYKNDRKEGKELFYWNDGSLRGEKNWVNGIQEGYSIDRKGDIKETSCYYLHGKRNGEWMYHDDNGEKIVCTYVNDKLDGIVKTYYPNGNIHATYMMKIINGESTPVGKATIYNKYQNGKIDHYEDAE